MPPVAKSDNQESDSVMLHKYLVGKQQSYDAIQDVFYEIDVLIIASWVRLKNGCETPLSLETRLLHTRNLIDFFEKTSRGTHRIGNERYENDDVLAQDFGFKAGKIGINERDRERLNKALAHITYERIRYRSGNDVDWPLQTTLLPVLAVCGGFAEYLIRSFLKEDDIQTRAKSADILHRVTELMEKVRELESA